MLMLQQQMTLMIPVVVVTFLSLKFFTQKDVLLDINTLLETVNKV